jgi:hypothetical protein
MSDLLDTLFSLLERCWPGVIGGLVAGFLVASGAGSIPGGLAAIAGTIGGTWLYTTRGRRARVADWTSVIANSLAALVIVGAVFTAFIFLSWAKWIVALAAIAVLAWALVMK